MQNFVLDPQLAADSHSVADLPLSAVRLMRDASYPWLLLVPRRANLAEIIDLDEAARAQLMAEIALACEALRRTVPCDKLNVSALGNVVRQLHVHVIARRIGDVAWPRTVWGAAPPRAYGADEAEALIAALAADLK